MEKCGCCDFQSMQRTCSIVFYFPTKALKRILKAWVLDTGQRNLLFLSLMVSLCVKYFTIRKILVRTPGLTHADAHVYAMHVCTQTSAHGPQRDQQLLPPATCVFSLAIFVCLFARTLAQWQSTCFASKRRGVSIPESFTRAGGSGISRGVLQVWTVLGVTPGGGGDTTTL